MKDLSDYFSSSPRVRGSINLEDKNNIATEISGNTLQLESNKLKNKKKRKKKSSRKPSDPAVKNVAELLSNSLRIISPNTSLNQTKSENCENQNKVLISTTESKNVELARTNFISSESELDSSQSIKENNVDEEKTDSVKVDDRLDAFQLMMESRNKSIGQNSPGKERPEDENNSSNEKELRNVLSTRKNLLQNWADKKGGIKRRRDEEGIDEIISLKLQKRAKRLKKLLQVNIENSKDTVLTKARRRVKRISSSSENSNDSVISVEKSSETLEDSKIEIVDGNAQDKVLNNSKLNTAKQDLLTFLGSANKSKNSEDMSNNLNVQELKKSKSKKKSKSESTRKKIKEKDESGQVNESVSKEMLESKKSLKKSKETLDESSQEYAPGNRKKCNSPVSKADDFTPRSKKSWKMKIKVNDENDTVESRPKRSRTIPNYKLMLYDESSKEGKPSTTKRKKQSKSAQTEDIIYIPDDEEKQKDHTNTLKVAPVFVKATPKPKIAPEVIEARKQFLMSGIPDFLKKHIEKQQSFEDKEYEVFPTISHVQQKSETEKFWNLPKVQLDLKSVSPLKVNNPLECSNLTYFEAKNSKSFKKHTEVDNVKALLKKIKSDNPNYPVYKSFRLIYEKSGKSLEKSGKTQIRRKSKKRDNKSIELPQNFISDIDSVQHSMWTDKYKPKCSDDIIGNTDGVRQLKKWLEMWKNFSEEINTKKKSKRRYSSECDFDTTDCDSRDSTKLPGNTVIVEGPCGCGKSTAIYAICNELDFNIIELNASSKRTGKRLLQELQEATQSHQVRKKNESMQQFFQSDKKVEVKETKDHRICVLLIEDVDIVFEQDDGFISALIQLVNTSKRPIVLTTTDLNSIFVQKLANQYEYISFLPYSAQSLATWLQIVCLVEGIYVNLSDVGGLLEYNKGDVRKTLLQLQLWVQSGGQINREISTVKTMAKIASLEETMQDDEQEPRLEVENSETKSVTIHTDCFKSFQIFQHHKSYRIPYQLNLGLLWWNIPNILSIPNFAEDRIKKIGCDPLATHNIENISTPLQSVKKLLPLELKKLESLSSLYDILAFTDVSYTVRNCFRDLEPTVKNCSSEVKDSLELKETMCGHDGFTDFVQDLTHSLVDGHLEEYIHIENNESLLNIAVPEKMERRWRAKLHVSEDIYREALPLSCHVERRSVALDYMPALRAITRLECHRAANNTKRGNRFRNYLRGLGINCNDNTLKLSCNILTGSL